MANATDTIEFGNVIARIETEGGEGEAETDQPTEEEEKESTKAPATSVAPVQSAPEPQPAPIPEAKADKIESTKFFSPVVLNIARSESISVQDLEAIEGSGISGRVTKTDDLN